MDKKTNKEILPKWDLKTFYSGINDPKLNRDLKNLLKLLDRFQLDHKGRLRLTLKKAILDYSKIIMLKNKLEYFIFLKKSTNLNDFLVKAKSAQVDRDLSLAWGKYMSFFNIELNNIPEKTLYMFYKKDTLVKNHRPWLEFKRLFKPHYLSEEIEGALAKRSPFGHSAWSEFYDELETDLEFLHKGKKKNLSEILNILTESNSVKERSDILALFNKTLATSLAKYSAQTLYMVAGSNSLETKERNYLNPMESRRKSNQVSAEIVDALHESVINYGAPLVRRYYRLKAAHLGLKKLHWSDRNAPMPFSDKTIISFTKATEIVLSAYQSFSPKMTEIIKNQIIDDKKIDAEVTKDKRSGGFNASVVLPGNLPVTYVFLNYHGSSRNVMTYAHELGHAVHGLLAGKAQGPLMYRAPMAYAETASIFGEKITFRYLKDSVTKSNQSRLALLMSKIDDVINTVVRQISFSNFERRLHGMDKSYKTWSEAKKYSVPELNQIWLETTKELYGQDGEVFTYENAEHLWSYIPHFHNPFYVYSYAFGELLTQNLLNQQSRLGERFEPLYLDLLKSGSTKNIEELVKPFGLDPAGNTFWRVGMKSGLGAMIEEAEEISSQMGVKARN